jgi:hypothetical protein
MARSQALQPGTVSQPQQSIESQTLQHCAAAATRFPTIPEDITAKLKIIRLNTTNLRTNLSVSVFNMTLLLFIFCLINEGN